MNKLTTADNLIHIINLKILKMNKQLMSLFQLSQRYLVPKVSNYARFSTIVTPASEVATNVPPSTQLSQPDKLYSTIELEMRGHDPAVLKSYAWFLTFAADQLKIPIGHNFALRKSEKERHTLLKSVHIYKKHRVQYEIRTYFRFLQLHRLTGSTADTYLEYIERNLPEGVSLKVTKIELQHLSDHIKPPST